MHTAHTRSYNWRKEYMPVLCGICALAVPGPLYYIINADLQAAGLGATLAMAALAGLLAAIAAPNVRAALLNVNGALGGVDCTVGLCLRLEGWQMSAKAFFAAWILEFKSLNVIF